MNPGTALLKIGSLYLMAGLVLGQIMAISGSFVLTSVHAHATLLGWGAMGFAGIIYQLFPRCAESRLARLHFWLHNLGLPVMVISLALYSYGRPSVEKFIGVGSVLVIVALGLFTVNLFRNAGAKDPE